MKQYFYIKDTIALRQFEWVVEEVNKKDSVYNKKFTEFRDNILNGEIAGNWTGVKDEFLAMSLCILGVPVYDFKGQKYTSINVGDQLQIASEKDVPQEDAKKLEKRSGFKIKTELGHFQYQITNSTIMGDLYYSTTKYTPSRYKITKGDPFKNTTKQEAPKVEETERQK